MAVALTLIYAHPQRSAPCTGPTYSSCLWAWDQEGWPFLGGVPGSDHSATRCLSQIPCYLSHP